MAKVKITALRQYFGPNIYAKYGKHTIQYLQKSVIQSKENYRNDPKFSDR